MGCLHTGVFQAEIIYLQTHFTHNMLRDSLHVCTCTGHLTMTKGTELPKQYVPPLILAIYLKLANLQVFGSAILRLSIQATVLLMVY